MILLIMIESELRTQINPTSVRKLSVQTKYGNYFGLLSRHTSSVHLSCSLVQSITLLYRHAHVTTYLLTGKV